MKFFIPFAQDMTQTEETYNSIKKWAKETTGWNIKDRKIYHIKFKHDGKVYEAKVGENIHYAGCEPVCAILESSVTYLVCTPNRGVLRGEPILVGHDDIVSIIDFET